MMWLCAFMLSGEHRRHLNGETLRAFSNHSLVALLHRTSHIEFGCRPDRKTCPSWDCAAHFRGVGCSVAHEIARDVNDAIPLLSSSLCHDKGLRNYAFTTEVWCTGETPCCNCRVRRVHTEARGALTCYECKPCCTVCDYAFSVQGQAVSREGMSRVGGHDRNAVWNFPGSHDEII